MQAFYSNSDLDEFLGENIETLLYAPRRLRTTCEKLDDDAWLQEQPIIQTQEIREIEDRTMFRDEFLAL